MVTVVWHSLRGEKEPKDLDHSLRGEQEYKDLDHEGARNQPRSETAVKKEKNDMSILGNILWLIFGGFLSGLGWLVAGLLWCITIVGIPVGVQCFKLAGLSFCPFGKEVVHGGGAGSFLLNVLWFIFSGLELAICNFLLGCLLCVTIVGIPFGKQFFKIAGLSLAPFGAEVH